MRQSFIVFFVFLFASYGLIASEYVLPQRSYEQIQAAQNLIAEEKTDEAILQLNTLLDKINDAPYEQAVTLQILAHAYIAIENYRVAIHYLQQSILLKSLPKEVQLRSQFNLAQLYLATDNFSASINSLNQWLSETETPNAQAYAMLGSAYLQIKNYNAALIPLKKAIDLSLTPKENWYQSLLGAHHELKNHTQCITLLQQMIALFPDKDPYWQQLAGMQLEQNNHPAALAVLELAYLNGRLNKETELLNLAQLYLQQNEPYKAAVLIEKELVTNKIKTETKTWLQLASAWYQARDIKKSIHALEKATKFEVEPVVFLNLAYNYVEIKEWKKAQVILNKLVKEKQLPEQKKSQAWLLLGISLVETDLAEEARIAFQHAKKFENTRGEAQQWLSFLE